MMIRGVDLICCLLQCTGIPWVLREVIHRYHPVVINYHDPSPETFLAHMTWFSTRYNFISMDLMKDAIGESDWSCLPPKSMIVTLDDGCAGNAELMAVIESLELPVTLYAVSGPINTKRRFWFNCVPRFSDEMTKLKKLSNSHRKQVLEEQFGFRDDRSYDRGDSMTTESIEEFMRLGGIVGSHTETHPLLTRCEIPEQLTEVINSRETLEKLTGKDVNHFAYPGGDWNAVTRSLVQQAGYLTARTTDPGYVNPGTDPWAIPNMGVSDNAGVHKAAVQASGLWYILKRLVTGSEKNRSGGIADVHD